MLNSWKRASATESFVSLGFDAASNPIVSISQLNELPDKRTKIDMKFEAIEDTTGIGFSSARPME